MKTILALLLCANIYGCASSGNGFIYNSKPRGYIVINKKISLPENHITNECGPESLVAVARYWGKDLKLAECARAIYSEKLGGTPSTQLAPYIRNLGFKATLVDNTSVGALKNFIDRQAPPIIMIDVSPNKSGDAFHFFIVVGYSDKENALLCQYYEEKYYTISYNDLSERWGKAGNFCLAIEPSEAADEFDWAAELENKQDYKTALEHFKKAIAKDPNHFLSYVGMGNMYLALDNLKQALATYQKAYVLNREDRKVLNALANIYVELGIYLDDAEVYASKAADRYKSYIEELKLEIIRTPTQEAREELGVAQFEIIQVYGTLGEARLARGEFTLAISTFQAALEIAPLTEPDFRAKRYYEIALAYLGLKKPKDARENLERAITIVKDTQLKTRIEKTLKEGPSALETK